MKKKIKLARILWIPGMLLIAFPFTGFAQKRLPDSITVAASGRYKKMSLTKRLFLGANYRKEWSVPVRMAVFDICDPERSYTIKGMGGGLQTKTLQLRDHAGREWALRTVDKDVANEALPKGLRKGMFNQPVRNIIQDMVSASYPYAGLTIPVLSKAAGVLTGSQQLFFVPDDTALGKFREEFANRVCLLEQRTLTGLDPDTEDTEEVLDSILSNNDHQIIQEALLRARLLDMLIADWDRHHDQWKWASVKRKGRIDYYAIPRDRDQAYFNSNGLLLTIISNLTSMRHMSGFREKSKNLKNLNYKSWQFDQVFLNELDRSEWEKIASEFTRNLSDSVIHSAIMRLPPEIYQLRGPFIEKRLRSRRDGLVKNVMKYYSFQAANVTVYGTDETEYFYVRRAGDKIEVSVYKNKRTADSSQIYQRVFDPGETRTIYLVGLKGHDHFRIEDDTEDIRFIINTDKNEDVFFIANNTDVKVKQ
jgi:hypothetical protein